MNPDSIKFLNVADVLLIQQDTIEHEGGGRGVRDLGLLESAVVIPRQTFAGQFLHEDIAAMAAAYLFHIAMNHPFVDGNKRAAAMSTLVFLDINGIANLPNQQEMEEATMAIASGQMDKDQLTKWLRNTLTL